MNNKIEGARIFVTGGAGFIGSNLTDKLLSGGAREVVVFDNLSRGRRDNLKEADKTGRLTFVLADIQDKDALTMVMENIDYVFHEAVIRVTHGQEDPRLCHEVVATGTANTLAACVESKVKKIILSSSTTVYGTNPDYVPIDEKHHRRPKSFYGAAKVYTEQLAWAYKAKYGLDFVCVRPFNVYGPHCDISTKYQEVIPKWVSSVSKNQPPVIHGNGTEVYDFTNVSDVVDASILALNSPINEGVYNVGTGETTSLNDLAQIIIQLMGADIKPTYGVAPENQTRVSKRIADTRKAEKELGFKAKISLKDGLQEFISWWKSQQK